MKKIVITCLFTIFLISACDMSNDNEIFETQRNSSNILSHEEVNRILFQQLGYDSGLTNYDKCKYLAEYVSTGNIASTINENSQRISDEPVWELIECVAVVADDNNFYVKRDRGDASENLSASNTIRRGTPTPIYLDVYVMVQGTEDTTFPHEWYILAEEYKGPQQIDCTGVEAIARGHAWWSPSPYIGLTTNISCDD